MALFMNRALDLLHRLRKKLWKLLRPRTRGVKVMLFNAAGELMLIRNSYGRSELWVLPGGGICPFEAPEAAARREIKEELGCGLAGLALLSTHFSRSEGKRDTIFLFRGVAVGEPRADAFEVGEGDFFALDDLPPTTSAATLRRVAEYRGARAADGGW